MKIAYRLLLLPLAVYLVQPAVAVAQMHGSGEKVTRETRAVTFHLSNRTEVVDLAALQKFPKLTLPNFDQSGSHGGARTWSGASLRDVLLSLDPSYCSQSNSQSRLQIKSVDGWTVYVKWAQVCGVPTGGEALFDVKGCSQCHGPSGEGVTQGRPAPALKNRHLDLSQAFARLQVGGDQHGSPAFTPSQLTQADLKQILGYLDGDASAAAGGYTVPENRRVMLLAYEVGGQPLSGADGLIQLVVTMDEFVGRFSHWVSDVTVQ